MQNNQRRNPRKHLKPASAVKHLPGTPAPIRSRPILAVITDEAATDYRREKHLPGLIRVLPWDLEADGEQAALRIMQLLRRALRIERQRGRCGHWTYDVNRHLGLVRAYKAESQRLQEHRGRTSRDDQADNSSRNSVSCRISSAAAMKS